MAQSPQPPHQKNPWTRGERIGAISLGIAILAIIVGLAQPEVRHFFHLDSLTSPSVQSTSTPSPSSTSAISSTSTLTPSATNTTGTAPSFPNGGVPVFTDPLQDNSRGYGWSENQPHPDTGNGCLFVAGTYHAYQYQGNPKDYGVNYCKAQNTNFTNFAFQIQMTILQGDCGGLLVNGDKANFDNPSFFYQFIVCQDGTYFFKDTYGKTLASGTSSEIHIGVQKSNLIAIVANKGKIDLYANNTYLTSVNNIAHTSGFIGVGAVPLDNHSTEVKYSNAKGWNV